MSAAESNFREVLERHFGYLFADEGFCFVWGLISDGGSRQAQVAASRHRKLKFCLDAGRFWVKAGQAGAPHSWKDDAASKHAWFDLPGQGGHNQPPVSPVRAASIEDAMDAWSGPVQEYVSEPCPMRDPSGR